jgi:hypothetical protein
MGCLPQHPRQRNWSPKDSLFSGTVGLGCARRRHMSLDYGITTGPTETWVMSSLALRAIDYRETQAIHRRPGYRRLAAGQALRVNIGNYSANRLRFHPFKLQLHLHRWRDRTPSLKTGVAGQ